MYCFHWQLEDATILDSNSQWDKSTNSICEDLFPASKPFAPALLAFLFPHPLLGCLPPTQEALLSSLFPNPRFNGMDLEAPGCGRCVLPSVVPGGTLLSSAAITSTLQGRHCPGARCGWLMGSISLLDTNLRNVAQPGRGVVGCSQAQTQGRQVSDVCSGRRLRGVLGSPLPGHSLPHLSVPRAGGSAGGGGGGQSLGHTVQVLNASSAMR